MPIAKIQLPDGRIARFEVPEGTTPEQVTAFAQTQKFDANQTPEPSLADEVKQSAGNLAAGLVRGAGSIGATLLTPYDLIAGNTKSIGNPERRKAMDDGLQTMGAETDSFGYGAGKLAGEIAGTAGAGGAIAKGLGFAPRLAAAVGSGGFAIGPGGSAVGNALLRTAGGAISGGASAGLVNPEYAGTGAVIGGAAPTAVKALGFAGSKVADGLHKGANRLMQSAIKPTIKELKSGDAAVAVQTLLDNGLSPNAAGVNKLRALIDDVNTDISSRIAGSTATIDKGNVVNALGSVRNKFANQVSPTGDLNAIRGVMDDFMQHPTYPGQTLPIQAAQELKKGTYKTLSKKYGQLGSAEVEAQKGLARGLKDEIANAIPEISGLNAQEAKLITTLNVAERRALMELNKNPMGLAALTTDPRAWAAFMADRSSAFKALAARMLNTSVNKAQSMAPSLGGPTNQLLIRSAPVALSPGE
jgi:hypothetical protein